jgi:recombination protein RecA
VKTDTFGGEMVDRVRPHINRRPDNYFAAAKNDVQFIPSGCKLLDLALGGGWAEGRISNIVGDKSTGKTLLAIEAAANFALKHSRGIIKYREAEAAFLHDYAAALGMPIDRVDFGKDPLETVEDLFDDLETTITRARRQPILYIVDSLDALSDRDELDQDIGKPSYGGKKAKTLSQMFRRLAKPMASAQITLLIISQIRDKFGVRFGRPTTRAGGRALDFYASQCIWLQQLGMKYKTITKVKRPIGVEIRAKVEKNKVGLPFREAQFQIRFGYGIEDQKACREWLQLVGYKMKDVVSPKELRRITEREWYRIETTFLPVRRKYHGQ